MNPRPDFCPGCGAQVYPEEANCPFCGRKLHSSFLLPFLVGLGGTTVALAAGGLVWWVMSAPPEPSAAVPATEQSAQTSAPPAPAQTAALPPVAAPAAPPVAAPAALPPAAAPPPGAGDPLQTQTASAYAPTAPDGQDGALPLPKVNGSAALPPADADARRAFAKSKQDSFVQNGLDLTVTASGDEATILTIKFNFPAKSAAELIVAGPFPRQCQQRGFRQVLFVDPSGTTWVYDVASQQLTQK